VFSFSRNINMFSSNVNTFSSNVNTFSSHANRLLNKVGYYSFTHDMVEWLAPARRRAVHTISRRMVSAMRSLAAKKAG
jgi:hypothetical protein